jgi:Protein of unknown function (DUF3551)
MARIRILAVATAAALVGLCASVEDAGARDYPYCAMRGGRGSYESCGYLTLAQCLATVRGSGGYCQPNPRFVGYSANVDEPLWRARDPRPRVQRY